LPRWLAATLATLVIAVGGVMPAAFADGDPASDFLLSQSTFLSPFDGHVAASEAARLVALLTQAQQKGLSLKVAVIVTSYDLGAVPILYGKPKVYAKFLGEEDYYYWKDELLVVMPDGYGIYKAAGVPAGDRATIDALKPPGTHLGTPLVLAAEKAVRALALRRGITLSAGSGGSSASTSTSERIDIAAAVVVAALLGLAARLGWRRRGGR
jgi:hypothetical protein